MYVLGTSRCTIIIQISRGDASPSVLNISFHVSKGYVQHWGGHHTDRLSNASYMNRRKDLNGLYVSFS